MKFSGNFYSLILGFNVEVQIESDHSPPIDWDVLLPLQFSDRKPDRIDISMSFDLRTEGNDPEFKIKLPFKKKDRSVFWTPQGRRIDLHDGTNITIAERYKVAHISGRSRWFLLGDLIESWLGWELERRGFARIHGVAIAPTAVDAEKLPASILIAREGFGKTTLALKCFERGFAILGEEVLFIKNGSLQPVRTVLRQKVDSGNFLGRFGPRKLHPMAPCSRTNIPINTVRYGLRKHNNLWPALCGIDVLIGLGLPQNFDFTLFPVSVESILGWIAIFKIRARFIFLMYHADWGPFIRSQADSPLATSRKWIQKMTAKPI